LEFFIIKAPPELSKAVFSATQERSLGLGTFGFHSYLQRNMLPFESALSQSHNMKIYKHLHDEGLKESLLLGEERGEAPDMIGTGRRHAHRTAIAPNANNASIAGTSASIELSKANAYLHITRAGSFLISNKYLNTLLNEKYDITVTDKSITKEEWMKQQWDDIVNSEGSVQHLDYLTQDEKDVFKTAYEVDQRWVVQHAGDRQQYICQGQSVNLFFPPGSDREYVHNVHMMAWKHVLKGLYYLRTDAGTKTEKVALKVQRDALQDSSNDECLGCSG
jgi:ribonucleoside-diphosphate reductase alpha chain